MIAIDYVRVVCRDSGYEGVYCIIHDLYEVWTL